MSLIGEKPGMNQAQPVTIWSSRPISKLVYTELNVYGTLTFEHDAIIFLYSYNTNKFYVDGGKSPVVWIQRSRFNGGIVTSISVASNPIEGDAGARLYRVKSGKHLL